MASDKQGMGGLGVPAGMSIGLLSLVLAAGVGMLLWKSQVETIGKDAGGGGPQQVIDRTRLSGTVVSMRQIASDLERYRAENGGYPAELALARRVGLHDSWGAPLDYEPSRRSGRGEDGGDVYRSYAMTSRGQDGLSGTRDDLTFVDGELQLGELADGDPEGVGGGRASEAEAGSGMVDPGPSGDVSPAGMKALDAARGIGSRGSGGAEGASEE